VVTEWRRPRSPVSSNRTLLHWLLWLCVVVYRDQIEPEDLLALALAVQIAANTVIGARGHTPPSEENLRDLRRGAVASGVAEAAKAALGVGVAAVESWITSLFGSSEIVTELVTRSAAWVMDSAGAAVDAKVEAVIEAEVSGGTGPAAPAGAGTGAGGPEAAAGTGGGSSVDGNDLSALVTLLLPKVRVVVESLAARMEGVNLRRLVQWRRYGTMAATLGFCE
jgi:hypothetical protein